MSEIDLNRLPKESALPGFPRPFVFTNLPSAFARLTALRPRFDPDAVGLAFRLVFVVGVVLGAAGGCVPPIPQAMSPARPPTVRQNAQAAPPPSNHPNLTSVV